MKRETRTVVYDDELWIEAYRFEGIVQPFPNHFHEHYVIGSVEGGQRVLSCKNNEYNIEKGNIVLFNPGDNHACVQSDDGTYFTNYFSRFIGLAPVFIVTYFQIRTVNSMGNKKKIGHLAALLTIVIWGTTFISTKILLVDFQPVEILFFRFVMGFFVLLMISPKRLKTANRKEELTFAVAGLCGICLYYLLENIALTYTLASNVGVIISVAPFFTAILAHLFMKSEEKPRVQFFAGFIVAMAGIVLISFNGHELELNPMGNLLAIVAALVWAFYSILTRKISSFGYPVILTTRRAFFYGILFMIPTLFFFDFQLELSRFTDLTYLFNILYLGLGASALCFVTWKFAVKELGAVKTSVYIYMVPVITVVTSILILHEQLTVLAGIGMILTLIGLFLSEYKPERNNMDLQNEKCIMVIDEYLPLGIIANTKVYVFVNTFSCLP